MSSTETPATPFERKLSDKVDELMALGKTGYVWGPVDEMLREELDIKGMTRCKQARGSGRGANVLTESNDKPIALYLIFVQHPYTIQAFRGAAERRIPRFPNVRCVAIADRTSGVWRVREIVERAGGTLANEVRPHFPIVDRKNIYRVSGAEAPEDDEEAGKAIVRFEDEDVFASAALAHRASVSDLAQLLTQFTRFLAESQIQVDQTTAVDVLATVLASQFTLFAGPSGTGKSTIARALARFFAPPGSWRVLEARRQWIGPEDVFGYFSPLTQRYALTADTDKLIDLHESSLRATGEGREKESVVPFVVVEEINLSPIEGYLAPVVHSLSAPSSPYIKWPLHARAEGASDADDSLVIPHEALLGPYPRVLGTINVDQNSSAPARKVAARAAVVLLEPDPILDAPAAATLMATTDTEADTGGASTPGQPWIGDPAGARRVAEPAELAVIADALRAFVDATATESGVRLVQLPRRDLVRVANYVSYYTRLLEAPGARESYNQETVLKLATENAFLHFVLPSLPAEVFQRVVETLLASEADRLSPASPDPAKVGGLLLPRLHRLQATAGGFMFAESFDFWASLS